MMTRCDMCGTEIKDSKCSCGDWIAKEEWKEHPLLKVIEWFHDEKKFTVTSDSPHLGCAVVLFRGGYDDCKKVEQFIYDMKRRPYYGISENQ